MIMTPYLKYCAVGLIVAARSADAQATLPTGYPTGDCFSEPYTGTAFTTCYYANAAATAANQTICTSYHGYNYNEPCVDGCHTGSVSYHNGATPTAAARPFTVLYPCNRFGFSCAGAAAVKPEARMTSFQYSAPPDPVTYFANQVCYHNDSACSTADATSNTLCVSRVRYDAAVYSPCYDSPNPAAGASGTASCGSGDIFTAGTCASAGPGSCTSSLGEYVQTTCTQHTAMPGGTIFGNPSSTTCVGGVTMADCLFAGGPQIADPNFVHAQGVVTMLPWRRWSNGTTTCPPATAAPGSPPTTAAPSALNSTNTSTTNSSATSMATSSVLTLVVAVLAALEGL